MPGNGADSQFGSGSSMYHPHSFKVEDIEMYNDSGFHPVELGNVLNKQYKVFHKLGYGGHSTVWLTRDTINRRYVAVKVIAASLSEKAREAEKRLDRLKKNCHRRRDFIGFSEGNFWVDGPNGRHLAIYSELMGPSLLGFIKVTRKGSSRSNMH